MIGMNQQNYFPQSIQQGYMVVQSRPRMQANRQETLLLNETPQGLKKGNLRGYTPKGDVLVQTSGGQVELWDAKNAKTPEKLFSEKERKIEILSAFAAFQHKIINQLSSGRSAKNN